MRVNRWKLRTCQALCSARDSASPPLQQPRRREPNAATQDAADGFLDVPWHAVFWDEAQKLKSKRTKVYLAASMLETPYRWAPYSLLFSGRSCHS